MDNFLNQIMNFINENTNLLIIICVFLIVVLVVYLIDNSIKTRRLAKLQLLEEATGANEVVKEEVTSVNPEEVKEEKVINKIPSTNELGDTGIIPISDALLNSNTFERPTEEETKANEVIKEEEPSVNPVEIKEEVVDFTSPVTNEVPEFKPVEASANTISLEPAVNDILLKDFTKNDTIQEVLNEEKEEVTLNPIQNVNTIETTKEPVYKNSKNVSDIFGQKKKVSEGTMELNAELDRILSKLNDRSETKDSILEETTDFTNMF